MPVVEIEFALLLKLAKIKNRKESAANVAVLLAM